VKSVIDGKLYDTEKAEYIAGWDNGQLNSNLDMVTEKLYQTKKGNFFLHREGGARSIYDGEPAIKPLYEEDEVKEWLENRRKAEAYIELFDPEEA
jgi:hypothetical protein